MWVRLDLPWHAKLLLPQYNASPKIQPTLCCVGMPCLKIHCTMYVWFSVESCNQLFITELQHKPNVSLSKSVFHNTNLLMFHCKNVCFAEVHCSADNRVHCCFALAVHY